MDYQPLIAVKLSQGTSSFSDGDGERRTKNACVVPMACSGVKDFLFLYPPMNRIVDQRQMLKIWENYVTELYDRPNRPETLEAEPEQEVDTDEKGPYILQSEVEKAIKEMRNREATRQPMEMCSGYWEKVV